MWKWWGRKSTASHGIVPVIQKNQGHISCTRDVLSMVQHAPPSTLIEYQAWALATGMTPNEIKKVTKAQLENAYKKRRGEYVPCYITSDEKANECVETACRVRPGASACAPRRRKTPTPKRQSVPPPPPLPRKKTPTPPPPPPRRKTPTPKRRSPPPPPPPPRKLLNLLADIQAGTPLRATSVKRSASASKPRSSPHSQLLEAVRYGAHLRTTSPAKKRTPTSRSPNLLADIRAGKKLRQVTPVKRARTPIRTPRSPGSILKKHVMLRRKHIERDDDDTDDDNTSPWL